MILDAAVIALSLAALAYVGRSMLRPRPALAGGSAAEEPETAPPSQSLSLHRLRDALPRRAGADAARVAMARAATDLFAPGALHEPAPTTAVAGHAQTEEYGATAAAPPRPNIPKVEPAAPLDVLIHVGGPGAPEVEVVDLSDPEDVCALEFPEDPTGHLHLLHGRAEAQLDAGLTRTAWLDVYLSRSDWLDRRDLDTGGEFPDTLATHVLRIDLGRTVTAPDGTVTGAINEDPELYFDRDIASEIEFSV